MFLIYTVSDQPVGAVSLVLYSNQEQTLGGGGEADNRGWGYHRPQTVSKNDRIFRVWSLKVLLGDLTQIPMVYLPPSPIHQSVRHCWGFSLMHRRIIPHSKFQHRIFTAFACMSYMQSEISNFYYASVKMSPHPHPHPTSGHVGISGDLLPFWLLFIPAQRRGLTHFGISTKQCGVLGGDS